MRFSANLSTLYPEHGFLDRFDAAAADGFRGVEYIAPYDYPAEAIAERLGQHGIVALIEPINAVDMPGYALGTLAVAEAMMAAVAHDNLRLQYDFYHMAMTGVALAENFARLLPRIGHVQVADAPGRHEPGTGQVDYAAVFAAVAASGYGGWIGAEYRPAAGTGAGLGWMRGL